MKKYYTNWKLILMVGIVVFLLIIGDSAPKYPDLVAIKADLFFLVVWGFIVLISTRYSYVATKDSTLKFVYILFIRRTIDINSITGIKDESSYKVAKGQFRSLYIFYKDKTGDTKWVELRITIFPEKTLGRLVKDLKEINPRIELNKYAQKLMESTS